MKMTKLGYFFEFLIFPPFLLIATVLAFRSSIRPQPVTWMTVFGFGLIGWTLIEYLLHRALFHHAPILARIHERHHRCPGDLIGTPAWASVSIALIVVAIPSWMAVPTANLIRLANTSESGDASA
jgi:sterol desaturase/sphingolipid hydroxylase (fatty acid hydroxylase superfamily)